MRGVPPSRPPRRRLPVWLAVAAISVAALGATGPVAAQKERFADQATVVVVEIPVQVTLDGRPMRGLTTDDFEVLEGRKRHPIVTFEEIDLALWEGVSPQELRDLPLAARRRFLLLFDLSFSAPSAVVKARRAARDLVLEGMHPTDLAAVATYSEARGADLVLGFTSDRAQVEAALEGLGVVDPIQRVSDPLRLQIAELEATFERRSVLDDEGGGGAVGLGPDADATFLEALKDQAALSGRATLDQKKNQILALSSSMDELAELMAGVEGRKYVVFFSEGFESSVLLGTTDAKRIQEMAEDAQFGEFWKIDSDERFGSGATQSGLLEMLDRFRKSDCIIQAVDIGGLRAEGDVQARPDGQDGLFLLANETGGDFYRNYNDLTAAMGALLERTSVTYLLTVQPRELGQPGDFHPLEVRLKKAPRGARVAHRAGFFAPTPFYLLSPAQQRMLTAEMLVGGRDGGPVFTSVLAAPFPVGGPRAQVLTLIEIDGPTLLSGHRAPAVPVEIYAYALDADGSVRDFFSQAIALDLDKVGDRLGTRGFKLLGDFELPPGAYDVRVLVRNALTGASGLKTARAVVPAFEGEAMALLPPIFIEPQGTWVLGRPQRSDRAQRPYPLMNGDQPVIPAALPMIHSGAEVPLLLVGHNLPAGSLTARGRLSGRDGGGAVEAAVALTGRLPADATRLDRVTARLAAPAVPPGEYLLELTLTDAETGRSVASAIPLIAR